MSLVGRSCWSWAGLGLWLAKACLACAIAVSLVFGAEISDRAWSRGIHVTPAQAAMHAALMAEGFAHHHGAQPLPAGHTATSPGDGRSVQPMGGGSTWSTPLMQAIDAAPAAGSAVVCCSVLPAGHPQPAGADLLPQTPPPEAA